MVTYKNIKFKIGETEIVGLDQVNFESLSDDQIFENKMVKFYWSKCLKMDGSIDLDLVDGSYDFSIIPKNKDGSIKDLTIGELREIVAETIQQVRKNYI